MRLSDRTWTDLDDTGGRATGGVVLCVPVGSCEQHGPHLPLATDTIVAEALAARLAAHRTDVVIAPALPVTASGEHAGFPGTLSIGNEVMCTVVVELIRSAAWATATVLVNGHGGNRQAVDRAVATLLAEGRQVLSWWPRPASPDHDAHAGRTETSMLLALAPHLVRPERAQRGETAPLADLADRLRAGGVRAVSPNGVLGDPTGASADHGRALLDRLGADLAAAVDAWLADPVAVVS